jgi:exportin-1
MFSNSEDPNTFKLHVRDFLIQLKEFAGDNSELYLDEREEEDQMKKKQEFEERMKIPGLVKPADRFVVLHV